MNGMLRASSIMAMILAAGCSIIVGPDNNLWFAESGAAKIGRITP